MNIGEADFVLIMWTLQLLYYIISMLACYYSYSGEVNAGVNTGKKNRNKFNTGMA